MLPTSIATPKKRTTLPLRKLNAAGPLTLLLVALIAYQALAGSFTSPVAPVQPAPRGDSNSISPAARPADHGITFSRLASAPLSFEPNMGQAEGSIHFQARGMGGMISFTPGEIMFALPGSIPVARSNSGAPATPESAHLNLSDHRSAVGAALLHMRFVGANPASSITGSDPQTARVNYFLGNDPRRWRTNIPTYGSLVYKALYAGIDLHYAGTDGQVKSTYEVAPGANPALIRWRYAGASTVAIDAASGNLVITLAALEKTTQPRTLTEQAPVAWQNIHGQRVSVPARYIIDATGTVGFALGDYDHQQALTIDPTLSYSTYLGGSQDDQGRAIAVDSAGNAYITGWTSSWNDFPIAQAPFSNTFTLGQQQVFVTKLGLDGRLLYSTYLGGTDDYDNGDSSWEDAGRGIALDSNRNIYITGTTSATDFPTLRAIQSSLNAEPTPFKECADSQDTPQPRRCTDAFVVKLTAAEGELSYSTYLGGSGDDSAAGEPYTTSVYGSGSGAGITVDGAGNAYIAGRTAPPPPMPPPGGVDPIPFPTLHPRQADSAGGTDAFIAKISTNGALLVSTYLGGSGNDSAAGIAIDSSGNAYIGGATTSTDFPLANALPDNGNIQNCAGHMPCTGAGDGFVTRIAMNCLESPGPCATVGSDYSTYLGGSDQDSVTGIAVDRVGNAYITGGTASTDFPTLHPLPTQGQKSSTYDAFITKLTANGARSYSSYLGGAGLDYANGIAVDASGNAYVTGSAGATDGFPVLDPLPNSQGPGAFVTKVSPNGAALVYSTFIGPGDNTSAGESTWSWAIAVDENSNAYITGFSSSPNLPVTPGLNICNPGTWLGCSDAFVAKLASTDIPTPTVTPIITPTITPTPAPTNTTLAITVLNPNNTPIADALVAIEGDDTLYTTDVHGTVTIAATPGQPAISVYAAGYRAQAGVATVTAGQANTTTIHLTRGDTFSVSNVNATALSQAEIVQRGIKLDDPQNQTVYDFTIHVDVSSTNTSITVSNIILPRDPVAGTVVDIEPDEILYGTPHGTGTPLAWAQVSGSIQYVSSTQFVETWIIIPGSFQMLKEFWDATIYVANNAITQNDPNALPLKNIQAVLHVPHGLSLPNTHGIPQTEYQTLQNPLPAGNGTSFSWVVRGDTAGSYTLSAGLNADLQLGTHTIPLTAWAKGSPITVYAPTLDATYSVPDYVEAGNVFTLTIGITNTTPITLNGVTASIKRRELVNAKCVVDSECTNKPVGSGTLAHGEHAEVSFQLRALVRGCIIIPKSAVAADPHVTTVVGIAPDCPRTYLVFSTQPHGGAADAPFTTQPVVTVKDANGNDDTVYSGTVTLAIAGGTGTPGAMLKGATSVDVVNGKATFPNLSIDLAGKAYVLKAVSEHARSARSAPFDVAPAPPLPCAPDFSHWDEDDLYTRASPIVLPTNSSPLTMRFEMQRYYGLVNTDTAKLIDVDPMDPSSAQDKDRNRKLHDSTATLYLWMPCGTKAMPPQDVRVTIRGPVPANGSDVQLSTFIMHLPAIPNGASLVKIAIPVSMLYFPNICTEKHRRTAFNCLRDPNKPNYGTSSVGVTNTIEKEESFWDIEGVSNKIEITSPDLTNNNPQLNPPRAYLFLNGVRPVMLVAGIDFPGNNVVKDTTKDWGNVGYAPPADLPQNYYNWIDSLSGLGIPNWNPPRNGTRPVDDQQKYLREGASFLKRVYGVRKIHIIAHSMGGVVSRQFAYENNVEKIGDTRIDKLITLDSPHTGVIIAGIIPFVPVPSNPAQWDLGVKQMSKFNTKYDLRNAWAPDQSKEHLFFTNAHGQGMVCKVRSYPELLPCKTEWLTDDGIIEDKSATGTGYPGVLLDLPQILTGKVNLPGVYATRHDPLPDICRHVITVVLNVHVVDTTCHEWAPHSRELTNWVMNTAHLADYTTNYLPPIKIQKPEDRAGALNSQASTPAAEATTPEVTLLRTSGALAANISTTIPITVDNLSDATINVATSVASQVRLEDTQGHVLIPDQEAPLSFSFTGTALSPGQYNLILTPGAFIAPAQYAVEVKGHSALAMATTLMPPTAGTAVSGKIEVMLTDTITNATVTAHITIATDTAISQTMDLTLAPDPVLLDGHTTYSAVLPSGLISQTIVAEVTASGTAGVPFTRQDSAVAQARPGDITFKPNASWQISAHDVVNATADIDTLTFNASVEVHQPGIYELEAALAAADGTGIATRSTIVALDYGSATVPLRFDGHQLWQQGLSGPYRQVSLTARRRDQDSSRVVDAIDDPGVLPIVNLNLDQLHGLPFQPNGPLTDSGTNPDVNGKFQTLQVRVPLAVASSGVYSYSAILRTEDESATVAASSGTVDMRARDTSALIIPFAGDQLYASGQNGPYRVADLLVQDRVSGQVLLYAQNVGETGIYQFSQFTGGPAVVQAISGAQQSANLHTAFAAPLQVLVQDAQNNPVSGVVVTFAAPGAGASGTFANGSTVVTATTTISGVASAPVLTANDVAGSYVITARVPGVTAPATFTLTNTVISTPVADMGYASISAGFRHTCGLRTDSVIACWGSNDFGQAIPPSGAFTMVSAGWFHTCGLRSDFSIACWGDNHAGQASPPSGGFSLPSRSFSQVSAGYLHSCGLRTNGTIVCWGDNYAGQATPPSGSFTMVSAGAYHTCGLRSDGTIACWGDNRYGQATPPSGSFSQVSTEYLHSCGVQTKGTIVCWGDNGFGEATPPSGAFSQVSAGRSYACGLRTDSTIACWGDNRNGQATPPSGSFGQVSAGGFHACGLRSDGTPVCWGDNTYQQATPQTPYSGTPWSIPGAIQAEDFDQGGAGVAYADTDLPNNGGQYRSTSVDIQAAGDSGGGYDVGWTYAGEWLEYTVNVSTTGSYALAVRVAADGAGGTFHMEVDGTNVTGAMRIPDTGGWQVYQTLTKPGIALTAGRHILRLAMDSPGVHVYTGNFNFLTLSGPLTVSAGEDHTCELRTDRTIVCWGFNGLGQTTPPSGTFSQIDTGAYHTCGLRSDGTLACGGRNDYGQATPPSGNFSQVSAGWSHTCGIRTDRTLACWGANYSGRATPPSGSFSQVSAGGWHTCGLRTDRTLACWGSNSFGQVTPPSGSFSQVSAGQYHTCALRTDSTLACWGFNSFGQATPPSGIFSQASAGGSHTCGVRIDGTIACWGDNGWGQATPPGAPTPTPTPSATPIPPQADQAEDFDQGGVGVAYADSDAPNNGGQYSSTSVDIDAAGDTIVMAAMLWAGPMRVSGWNTWST